MIIKSPCMPKLLTIGSKSKGEENCPRKKLEVRMPEALPRLCGGTLERNQALVLTSSSPNAIPMGTVAKKSVAMESALAIKKSPVAKSRKVKA